MAFKKIYTTDKDLQIIQDNVDDAVRPLQTSPLSKSVLVKDQTLKSGQDNLISHGLGKAPLTFIVAAINTSSSVWSQPSTQLGTLSSNERLINIRCSSDCRVSFLFA